MKFETTPAFDADFHRLKPEHQKAHLTNVAWRAFTLRQLLQTNPSFDDRPAQRVLPTPMPTLAPTVALAASDEAA